MQINRIYLGDSFELDKEIPDKSVDMILEDMPYNKTQNEWEYDVDLKLYWKSRLRIIKDGGLICLTAIQPFVTDLIISNRNNFKYDLIWYKALGTGHLNCNRMPMRNHEHILMFYLKLPKYNPQKEIGKMRSKGSINGSTTPNYGKFKGVVSFNNTYYPQSVIDISNGDRTKENIHPTQKPVALFEYLIKTYTNEGDLVFDGFAGSGTTAVACLNTKRNFICIEKEQKYFDKSIERLEQQRQQFKLAV